MDIRVWVGCLACYNGGRLNGEWVDAADASDWKCKNPTHEETWCFDHEIPGVSGEVSPMEAVRWAEVFAEVDESNAKAFAAWLKNETRDPSEKLADKFRDAFRGQWDSDKDFAMQYAEDMGFDFGKDYEFPLNHVDWDSAAGELMMDHYEIDGYYFLDS